MRYSQPTRLNWTKSHCLVVQPATERTFVCALLLSEIWYTAIFSNCVVYLIIPTVTVLVPHGLMPLNMLFSSSCLPLSSVTENDQSPCFGQQHGGNSGNGSNTLSHVPRHGITVHERITPNLFAMQYPRIIFFSLQVLYVDFSVSFLVWGSLRGILNGSLEVKGV